jgi:outer membrane receptor protein involved in Fe transport
MEVESEFRIARGIRGLANYSYQDVENENGSRIDFSPQHKANVGLQAKLSAQADAYLGVHFVGSSVYHAPTGLQNIQAYARIDGRLGYRLGTSKRPWTVSAVVTNLFDNRHLEVPVATAPGSIIQSAPQRRSVYFMLTGKF